MKNFRINSLIFQFLVLVVSSLLFLTFMAAVAYYELTDYALRFSKVTDYSMPKLVKIASIHSNIKELSYLIEHLSDASSGISKRIAYRRIDEIFILVKEDELTIFNEKNLNINIQVIEEHYNRIYSLLMERENYSEQIREGLSSFIKEMGGFSAQSEKLNRILNPVSFVEIQEIHSRSELKSFARKIKQSLNVLRESNEFEEVVINIENSLFASDGIVKLKYKELNAKTRLKRQINLISSLLYNFSNEIEFLSVNLNDTLIQESKESALALKKEINVLLFLFLGYLAYLTFIVFYLKHKTIDRLVLLNKNIQQKIEGGDALLTDNYDDEISYIIKSFNFYALKAENQNRRLEELSLTDALTNLPNRRMFDIRFENELYFIRRNDHVSSVILIDVDNFKLYNDNYGHLYGDRCLKDLAEIFRKSVRRDTDTVARYGGEEFVFILSNSNIDDSKKIARELLDSVEKLNIEHKFNNNRGHVTVSIGITTIDSRNCELGKINIENADKALYAAKEKGKNTFVHYNDFDKGESL